MEVGVQPHSQAHERHKNRLVTTKIGPYACLCVLVCAAILPFAGRAVYLDEPQYLHVAQSAIEHSWVFPQDTGWLFFGKRYVNLATQTHLPVVEYYLAVLLKVAGRFDEVRFRLLFAVFPLFAVVSFYRLARYFTPNPLVVSCLFAVSPAFFVLSPTLMMDIPMLAFLLAGLSFYLDAVQNCSRLWPSSVCFILAAGTGYTTLVPLACLFIWAVYSKRPKREWIAIAAAPAGIVLWLAAMQAHFGGSPAIDLVGYYTSHMSVSRNVLPLFSFLGGVAVFPWIYMASVEKSRRLAVAIAGVLGGFGLSLFHTWSSISYRLWFVLLASSGLGLLIVFARKAIRLRSEEQPIGQGFLFLWFPATLLFLVLFAEMMTARYILLTLPPLFLVVFNHVTRKAAAAIMATGVMLSVSLAVADYRLVTSYPKWVEQTIVPLQKQQFRMWNAAESGLRFYVERKGIETLDKEDLRPRGADLIIRQASFEYGLSEHLESVLVNVYATTLPDNFPIRTFSRDAGAAFHDSQFGLVPFTMSRAPLDRLEIAQVSPLVKELPEVVPDDFSTVPVWFPGGVVLKQIEPEMKFPIRIPQGSRIEYELEGSGSIQRWRDGIVLKKQSPGPILWKNFRIVPETWATTN